LIGANHFEATSYEFVDIIKHINIRNPSNLAKLRKERNKKVKQNLIRSFEDMGTVVITSQHNLLPRLVELKAADSP